MLARPRVRTVAPKKKETGRGAVPPRDEGLFQALRVLRKRLADEAGVPPFVVFADTSLSEMAARRPQTAEELLQVSGVGEHKLGRYGAAFLEVIRGYAGG